MTRPAPLNNQPNLNKERPFMDLLTLERITYNAIADCDECGFQDFCNCFYVTEDGAVPKVGCFHSGESNSGGRRARTQKAKG